MRTDPLRPWRRRPVTSPERFECVELGLSLTGVRRWEIVAQPSMPDRRDAFVTDSVPAAVEHGP
jgi:hypothetical protein